MTRRVAVLVLVVAVLVGAAACGDDDNGGKDASPSTTRSSTQATRSSTTRRSSNDPACKELTVLLKPDVTADQKAAIEAKLKKISQVKSWRYDAKGGAGGGAAYKVVPDSPGDEATIGNQFALDGVVSVVYPNQVC